MSTPILGTLKRFSIQFAVAFGAIFAVLWGAAEPLGLQTGRTLFAALFCLSAVGAALAMSLRVYNSLKEENRRLSERVALLERQVQEAERTRRGCCVLDEYVTKCPVGLQRIYPSARSTLRTSLETPTRSFRWLGLSAFNVVHNNHDIMGRKKNVHYSFTIQDPKNTKLQRLTDAYYGNIDGKLTSRNLTSNSNALLKAIQKDLTSNVKIEFHQEIPTFRIAIIDENIVQASFYQRGGDVLERPQLEFRLDEGGDASIGRWLVEFYDIVTQVNPSLKMYAQ